MIKHAVPTTASVRPVKPFTMAGIGQAGGRFQLSNDDSFGGEPTLIRPGSCSCDGERFSLKVLVAIGRASSLVGSALALTASPKKSPGSVSLPASFWGCSQGLWISPQRSLCMIGHQSIYRQAILVQTQDFPVSVTRKTPSVACG
jgi:hypothetical protein